MRSASTSGPARRYTATTSFDSMASTASRSSTTPPGVASTLCWNAPRTSITIDFSSGR
jgi:hypothetical protein